MQKTIATAFMICLLSGTSFAQQTPYVGMHHLKPKPAQPAPEEKKPEVTEAEEEIALPVYKPITAKDALIKQEDLETWNHLDEAATSYSELDVQKLVHLIESDRGAVPPQGLFLAAKALTDRGLMEQAAVYFFVGQLRLTFDKARWPTRDNEDDVKRLSEDNKKSEDQQSPNRSYTPRTDNPHQGIEDLANMIGAPIMSWMMKDQQRIGQVMRLVRQWDSSCTYAYLPDYDLTEPVAFEKWAKILVQTREDFFAQMESLSKAMSKVRQ